MAQGEPDLLPERHLVGGHHGAVELLRHRRAEAAQKDRVGQQPLPMLLQVEGEGVHIGFRLDKERCKLHVQQLHVSEDVDPVEIGPDGDGGVLVRHVIEKQLTVHHQLQKAAGGKRGGQQIPGGVVQQQKAGQLPAEQASDLARLDILVI